MVKLTGPLMSLLASGLVKTGLQMVQVGQSAHLVKPHRPRTTYTRSQKALRSYVDALAKAWSIWPPSWKYGWNHHPRAVVSSAYHAYLWENHRRREQNLWPLFVWDSAPVGSPPTITWGTGQGGARRLSYRIITYSGLIPVFAALYHTPPASFPTDPLTARGWSWSNGTGIGWHHILRVDPGTYTIYIRAIDCFGRCSAFTGFAGLVATP